MSALRVETFTMVPFRKGCARFSVRASEEHPDALLVLISEAENARDCGKLTEEEFAADNPVPIFAFEVGTADQARILAKDFAEIYAELGRREAAKIISQPLDTDTP